MSSPEQRALKVWGASENKIDGATRLSRLFWLRRMCLPSPPAKILDVGSGQDAGVLNWIAGDVVGEDLGIGEPEMEHAGVDVNPEFIEYTRIHRRGQFEIFDLFDVKRGMRMPFEDSSFDVVLATEVIEHLFEDDWIPVLKELKRLSCNQILLTVPDAGLPNRDYDRYPEAPSNELYVGHQFEPCWVNWKRIIRQVFPESVRFRKILGFFTAVCYV